MASMTLTCVQCKTDTKSKVRLIPLRIPNKLMVFICPSEGCPYPLNSGNFHKFVFKGESESELQRFDPSEAPTVKDIYESFIKLNQSELEKLPGALPESKEKQSSQFSIWTNRKEFCLLHPTLCLLVHNKAVQHYFKFPNFGNCHVKKFSRAYIKAASSLNSCKPSSKSSVQNHSSHLSYFEKVRQKAFEYLQPSMACEMHKQESSAMPVVLLLKENMNLHEVLLSIFTIKLKCDNCGHEEASQKQESFVLILGTVKKFEESGLIYSSQCSQCRSEGQMTLQFHDFSRFLLMYFIEGLPSNNLASMEFFGGCGSIYGVKGFVQHNLSNQNFIPWIRCDEEGKQWKCCDDLHPLLRNLTTQLSAIPASEIRIVMWELKTLENVVNLSWLCSSWADIYKMNNSKSTNPKRITLGNSDSEDGKINFVAQKSSNKNSSNAEFQNSKEGTLQPSKNLSNNKSVLEDCKKAVVEMKASNADEKSESTICDVSSNSKNEAGVGESKNWNSSMDFEAVAHDVEGCTDTETNTNDRLRRGGNMDSLSQVVKGMSRSEHETSKTSKRKSALHFQTTPYSEVSYDTSLFGKISECHVVIKKIDVEMFAKKRRLGRQDADKEDSCSQSTTTPSADDSASAAIGLRACKEHSIQ